MEYDTETHINTKHSNPKKSVGLRFNTLGPITPERLEMFLFNVVIINH